MLALILNIYITLVAVRPRYVRYDVVGAPLLPPAVEPARNASYEFNCSKTVPFISFHFLNGIILI